MKKRIKNTKLLKFGLIILVLAAFSVSVYFICKAIGITDVATLRGFIESCGAWGIVVFVIIRIAMTMFMCFVPAISMIFDLLAVALFGATWQSFLICLGSVFACSFIMYALGRAGAYKIFEKIIGKDDLDKANTLIKEKGLVFYPIMMACGGFPDDALVLMAGVVKMNPIYFTLSTTIGRGIGCAFTIFGISLIPFAEFTRPYDWMVFICCIIVLAFVIIKGGNLISDKVSKLLEKKNEKK